MRIEQHPKLVITHKDIDKINEVTNLINDIFDEFIDLDYEDEELNELAIEFENAKDKLLDVFDSILCDTDKYENVIEIKESQLRLTLARAVSHFAQKLASNFVQHSRLTFPPPHDIINSTSKERLIKPPLKP